MAKWIKNFSWENLFDGIAAKSPDFVKIAVVAGKSFLYYHGLTRAAALTYTTILAVIPLLILLTSITLAAGFGNFISDYLPHLLDMFSLDWPTEPIVALIENAEHVPIGKLGIIGAAAFLSRSSSPSVAWNRISTSFGRTRPPEHSGSRPASTLLSSSFWQASSASTPVS